MIRYFVAHQILKTIINSIRPLINIKNIIISYFLSMYHGAISTSQLPEVFEEEEQESSQDYFDSENRNRNRHDSGIEELPSRQRSK